jgi:competence ComEA-like helix-hairpin-helix protein
MDGQLNDKGRLYMVGTRLQLPEDEARQLEMQRRVVWAPVPKRAGKAEDKAPPGPELPLDVNEATAEQLAQLDGIDEDQAKAIVGYRDEHGPFASIAIDGDDKGLTVIKGIGKAGAAKLAAGVLEAKQPEPPELLNVNEATAEQLQEIDGIGDEIAEAIVNHVKGTGAFTSIDKTEDDEGLTVISGIAEETAQELTERLTV